MKNFFSSPPKSPDLQSFSKLDLIQKELRHARDDHAQMQKDLSTIVRGIALMVSAPTEEDSD